MEPQSETVWRQADNYKVPRICFLNKMDRVGASFIDSFSSIEKKLSLTPVALQWPVGLQDEFQGLFDLIEEKMYLWDQDKLGEKFSIKEIPKEFEKLVKEKKELLIEKLAENDDSLMDKYLKGEEVSVTQLKQSIRKQTLNLQIAPVLCGSAFKNKGIQPLLSAVKDYLPSPLDITLSEGKNFKGESIFCLPKDEEPLSALAFKISFDSFSGALTYIRVYSGVLKVGQQVYNSRQDKVERIQKILKMHSNSRKAVSEIRAGDIAVVAGLKWTQTGDSLCVKERVVSFERLSFPEPVLSVAIEPKSSVDQLKIESALKKLEREDPSCQIKKDSETGQMLLLGMGELHVEILLDRLLKDYKVSARIGKPQVSFRETLAGTWEGFGEFNQEIQGRVHFAKINLKIESLERGKGFVFNRGAFLNLSPEIFSALMEGFEQGLSAGPLMAYPMKDLQVSLLDLKYKEEDISLLAIRSCAYQTFSKGVRSTKIDILEPIFRLKISSPEEFTGAIIGDLNTRKGRVEDIDKKGDLKLISALAPLTRIFGYATDLRSLSQGRASFSMEMHGYAKVSEKEKQKMLI